MPRIDWNDVPDSNILPMGLYELEIENVERTINSKQVLMYKGTFRVAEGAFKGTPYFENFNIGSETDPMADEPQTLKTSIGLRILKQVFKASQMPFVDDLDEMCTAVQGQHVIAQIDQSVDDGVRNPKYKGTVRNRVARWYKVGERATGVTTGGTSAPAAPAASRVAAPAAAATATCRHCQAVVPRSAYQKHVEEAHPELAE